MNKFMKSLLSVAIAAICVMPFCAMAETVNAGHVIDFVPTLLSIVDLVFAALGAVGLWLLHGAFSVFKTKTGIEVEDKMRSVLEVALVNGIHYARSAARGKVESLGKVTVENEVIATAATYVLSKVPDTAKYFNLDEAAIRDLVMARLPQIESGV